MAGQIHEDAAACAQKIDRTEAVAAHTAEHLDGAIDPRRSAPGPRVAPVIPPLKPDLESTPAARTACAAASALGTESASGFSRRSVSPLWPPGDVLVVRDSRRCHDDRFDVVPGQERLDVWLERTERRRTPVGRAGVRHRRPRPRGERR